MLGHRTPNSGPASASRSQSSPFHDNGLVKTLHEVQLLSVISPGSLEHPAKQEQDCLEAVNVGIPGLRCFVSRLAAKGPSGSSWHSARQRSKTAARAPQPVHIRNSSFRFRSRPCPRAACGGHPKQSTREVQDRHQVVREKRSNNEGCVLDRNNIIRISADKHRQRIRATCLQGHNYVAAKSGASCSRMCV